MGLISREMNNGTIKLLYSSPVTIRQIVLGKYLAVVLYNLLLVLIAGVFVVTGIFNIRAPEYGMLLSALLGFFLLVSAFAAIGMFMSSLTTYQIVSAIGCFVLFFVLDRIGNLWQEYDLVRDITYFLSIGGRTFKMLKGLITTNDVMYFVVISYMFLGFTMIRLKVGRESKPWFVTVGRYSLVAVSAILMGYCTSRPGYIGYWDTTHNKVNTLHENTQQLLRQMDDGPIEVTLYTNLLDDNFAFGRPSARNNYIWTMWEKYLRFKPDIRLKYVYYYDMSEETWNMQSRAYPGKSFKEYAALQAKMLDAEFSRFQDPAAIRKKVNLKDEDYRLVMKVTYKGKSAFLRTFQPPNVWPEEDIVSATFSRLLKPYTPKVYYVTGDWERDIYKKGEREYMAHAILKKSPFALINHGFELDTLSLNRQDIPASTTTVVLADPKSALSPLALEKLRRYLNNGGNMLILSEPGKQEIVNPVLQPLGVQMMKGTLVEITRDDIPHKIMTCLSDSALELAQEDLFIDTKRTKTKPRPDTLWEFMRGITGISFADSSSFTVNPLMYTLAHRNTWAKVGRLVTDSAAPVFTPTEGDYKQPVFYPAVALHRQLNQKEQRIIIFGDADFLDNFEGGGPGWFKAIFSWLDNNVYPKYVPKAVPKDTLLSITNKTAKIEKLVLVWIIPGLILLAGIILLIRRKRQ
jgi:ABC-2 type transport system permease protein